MSLAHEFILFYDGHCPICRREVAWLASRNKQGKLVLQDIHQAEFDPALYGKSLDELMAEIHGVYADGRLIKGVEVFCAAYSAVGLEWLVAPMRWPWLAPLFDSLYARFARHRLRLGGLMGAKGCRDAGCRLRSNR